MTRLHVRKALQLGAAVLLLSGCATYQAVELDELPIGRQVRVQLSRQAFAGLPQISDQTGTRFAGTLMSKGPTAIRMRVPISIGSPFGQEIDIPTNGIVVYEIREISRVRSTLAVGVGFGVLIAAVVASSSDQGLQPPEDVPQDLGEEFTGGPRRTFSISIPLF